MERKSFPPVVGPAPKLLILGSMPGVRSLEQAQYYAHPQNLFWKIMEDNFLCDFNAPYGQRITCLTNHHIALWDVLASCYRPGSLDSDIAKPSPNPISQFVSDHPSLERILLNGKSAEKWFRKFFPNFDAIDVLTVPSTSPANASVPRPEKQGQWKKALQFARVP